MNKSDRAALREMLERATPGPWKCYERDHAHNEAANKAGLSGGVRVERSIHTAWNHSQLGGPAPVVTTGHTPFYGERTTYLHINEEDATFIVAARNSLANLLSYVDALETIAGAIDDTEMDEWCSDAALAEAIAAYRKAKR